MILTFVSIWLLINALAFVLLTPPCDSALENTQVE